MVLHFYELKLILRVQNTYTLTGKLIKRLQLTEELKKYRNKNWPNFLKKTSFVILHFYELILILCVQNFCTLTGKLIKRLITTLYRRIEKRSKQKLAKFPKMY